MNRDRTSLYGLVLTGGRSSRMGSDKAALEFEGQQQSERAVALLSGLCEKVFLSNRQDQAALPGHRSFPQIHDRFGELGPIGGILSALDTHPGVAWLVLACDLPLLDRATLDRLLRGRNPAKIATAYRSAYDGLPEPLCAVYEPHSLSRLRELVAQGVHCPRKALAQSDAELLELENRHALDNMNSPRDLQEVRAQREHGGSRTVHVNYFAMLREASGCSTETLATSSRTAAELYDEAARRHGIALPRRALKVAVNDRVAAWDSPLADGDSVSFIPPVSGG